MIKKAIGVIVALAVLAIIVMAVLGHGKYKSVIETAQTESTAQ